MTHIPTRDELKNKERQDSEAARQERIQSDVSTFRDLIVAAMDRGESYLSVRTRMPEPEAQTILEREFADSGWSLAFHPARTGGSIDWT